MPYVAEKAAVVVGASSVSSNTDERVSVLMVLLIVAPSVEVVGRRSWSDDCRIFSRVG